MFQRVVVAAIFFSGQLFGALVQLRGHVGGFFGGTAKRDEDLGELGNFHGGKFNQENRNAGNGT
jgi:hypothetical protein